LGERLQSELLGLLAFHHDHGRAAIGDLRCIAGRDGSVLLKDRRELRQRLARGIGADPFVGRDQHRLSLSLRDLAGHDLLPDPTRSASPARINWSARAMAFSPDRHTFLMVIAVTSFGIPAAMAAWRAVICPAPAWRTCPMITYWTSPPVIPERSSAALMTMPPRSVAARSLSQPSSRPMAVRAPPAITPARMVPPLTRRTT